ncbi:hypothetical protein SNE510_36960 [Streptomyces sp. NE5-10]|nr:hypothetical protein SNE510_36960 [Streptomyces sp. NE5-10]
MGEGAAVQGVPVGAELLPQDAEAVARLLPVTAVEQHPGLPDPGQDPLVRCPLLLGHAASRRSHCVEVRR